MSKQYEQINFALFSEITEAPLEEKEKRRLRERFYQEIGQEDPGGQKVGCLCGESAKRKKRLGFRAALTAAACVCLIVCAAATPAGEKAWAAVKNAFVGIGEFLGMEKEDGYAMKVEQTRHQNGITATLKTAVASDREFRFSIYTERDDGRNIGDSKVSVADLWIDGRKLGTDIEATGNGAFGGVAPNQKGMHYLSSTYIYYEMPVNPQIRLDVWVEEKLFTYEFTLENEAFKAATKEIPLDVSVPFGDKMLELDKLIITPIDQVITMKNDESDFDCTSGDHPEIYGTDDEGNQAVFHLSFGGCFYGSRYDPVGEHYELDYDVSSYTLQVYDTAKLTPQNLFGDEGKVGDSFTVRVPE